jgi:4-aminobutyrate aminotransferase-like enzyme
VRSSRRWSTSSSRKACSPRPAGLRPRRPARDVQRELLERGILTGTSADPHVVRVLAPYVLEESHVIELAAVLAALPA